MLLSDVNSSASQQVYDVCVIGAGAAGLFLASKLGDKGLKVAIIESGNESRWNRTAHSLNRSELAGLWHYGVHTGRYRAIGGSTSRWAGQLIELDESDFDAREWIGFEGWPIKRSEISRYYNDVMDLVSIKTADIKNESDIKDIVNIISSGGELDYAFSQVSPTLKFFGLFKENVVNRNNEHYFKDTCALELMLNDGHTVCNKLKCADFSGEQFFVPAKFFVICMGGIENSRFLLNNGNKIRNKSAKIGKHFQDHVNVHGGYVTVNNESIGAFLGPERILFQSIQHVPKIKLTTQAQKKFGILNAAGMVDYDDKLEMLLKTVAFMIFGPAGVARKNDILRFAIKAPYFFTQMAALRINKLSFLKEKKRRMVIYCEQDPNGTNSISLSNNKDRFGYPLAKVDWRISDLEVKTSNCFLRTVRTHLESNNILKFDIRGDFDIDYVASHSLDSYHHIGGTRMSDSETTGVVNQNLKVYGVDNLYVCGSSVFPCGGFVNPTHTILALSLRLADHLMTRFDARAQ